MATSTSTALRGFKHPLAPSWIIAGIAVVLLASGVSFMAVVLTSFVLSGGVLASAFVLARHHRPDKSRWLK